MTTDEKRHHVDALVHIAKAAKLEGSEILDKYTVAELAEIYNGIGPEFLPEETRNKVTEYLAIFEAAALIHDVRYNEGDGTRKAFNLANVEFRANCRKLAEFHYAWYNWRRYRAYAVSEMLYKAVASEFGWIAFKSASGEDKQKICTSTDKSEQNVPDKEDKP